MTTIDPTTAPTTTPASVASAPANTLSIVSLALGIAGLLVGQGILSIAAVVLAFVARSREPQAVTTANWGLVLGLIGLLGGIVIGFLALVGFAPLFLLGAMPWWY